MYRLAFLSAALVALAVPASAASPASPNPKDLAIPPGELSRAAKLVALLGSEDFDEREDAQENLAKMGRLARPALLKGLNSDPSPEVRFRCQSLIRRAAHEELQARLATFLADVDAKYEHDLAGWNEFKKVAGNSSASRAVFAEMLSAPKNREMVLAIAGTPAELGGLIAARKQQFYTERFPRTPNAPRKEQSAPDLIALMFAESHVESKNVPRTVSSTTIYNQNGLKSAVDNGGDKAPVYKAIIGHWIETRDDAVSMQYAMQQATTFGLSKQGNALAAKLVQFKGASIYYRMNAALTLAKHGAKEHLAAIESAFNEDTNIMIRRGVVNGGIETVTLQVRDIALAAAIMLTEQKTVDYGLVEQYKQQPAMQYTYTNWRMPEDKRKAAFEKWKAWRAKNPDFGKK
ncbi:MAG TPA: hypothetical protein VN641_15240 [Urbifossiella sp.]|nr:hypothetical protein [Urbifossiella sp.]